MLGLNVLQTIFMEHSDNFINIIYSHNIVRKHSKINILKTFLCYLYLYIQRNICVTFK